MAIIKSAAAANKFVNETLKAAAEETAELKNMIDSDLSAIAERETAMNAASRAGNIDAYRTAKDEKQFFSDSLEMHKARLEELSGKILISPEEYQQKTADIIREFNTYEEAAKNALAELSEKMNGIATALESAMNETNNALHGLQADLFRNSDRRMKNGQPIFSHDEKSVSAVETAYWGRIAVSTSAYKDFKKLYNHASRKPDFRYGSHATNAADASVECNWKAVAEELE